MTGGQASPTTIIGQKTTTTPLGGKPEEQGYPLKVAEILSNFEGVAYAARVAVNNPKRVMEAKKALIKAFLAQLEDKGFGSDEVLSACPINWKMDPVSATKYVDKLTEIFPLGVFRETF